MLRKSAAVLAVVLCLANSNATRADPGPVVTWLMNEPISLFDLGMHRLSNAVRDWPAADEQNFWLQEFAGMPSYSVAYDWDLNRIFIRGNMKIVTDKAKEACRAMIDAVHLQAYMDAFSRGEVEMFAPGSEGGYSRFAGFFSHYAYGTQSEPEEYRSRLDNIIILEATVLKLDLNLGADTVKCFQPLTGGDNVYFEE